MNGKGYEKEIIQKCPECHQEVNICCSNENCVCRKGVDPKTILKNQWVLFGVEISEKLGDFLWNLGWKISPIRNWNDDKLIETLKCPHCGHKKYYSWWEDDCCNQLLKDNGVNSFTELLEKINRR